MSSNHTPLSIYGIETEYSTQVTKDSRTAEIVGSCHSPDFRVGLYTTPDSSTVKDISESQIRNALRSIGLYSNSIFLLSNGGRLYMDPSGLEYATPEAKTAEDAVHRSFDGDEIVYKLLHSALPSDEKPGIIDSFQLNRRIIDHNRASRGVHLNHLTELGPDPDIATLEALQTLNVIKGAIFGSGGLLVNKKGNTEFHHSPRLSVTTHSAFSEGLGYGYRPLVRAPFKRDAYGMFRIETITSDALNFPWPLRASLVTTNALIKMLEFRESPNLPLLTDPVRAAQTVGKLGSACQVSIMKDDGSRQGVRPLDILRSFAEHALNTNQKTFFLDDESKQVLDEVVTIADMLTADPLSAAHSVESVARYITIKKRMEKDGLKIDSETICRFDYAWDKIGGGIAERIRKKNITGWHGFSQSYDIRRTTDRIKSPPQNTRAKVRGEHIRDTEGKVDADWQYVVIDGAKNYLHPARSTL